MMLRRLHYWFGVLATVVFLLTGQFMRHHQPPMTEFSSEIRLLFRSRHIYILAAALVNLMLGLYLQREMDWRGRAQLLGSLLVLASPLLLVYAFVIEPERGFEAATAWSHWGLYALFAGCMLHFAASLRKPRK